MRVCVLVHASGRECARVRVRARASFYVCVRLWVCVRLYVVRYHTTKPNEPVSRYPGGVVVGCGMRATRARATAQRTAVAHAARLRPARRRSGRARHW